MELQIYSKDELIINLDDINVKTAIVSIFTPKYKPIKFDTNPFVVGQFIIKIYDMDIGEAYHCYITPPTQKKFNGLKKFIDEMVPIVDQIIVHCDGGISRSAGLAAAIDEYLNLNTPIWTERIYHPNLLVYKLACKELGVKNSLTNMQNKFNLRLQYSMFGPNDLGIYFNRYIKRNSKKNTV